MDHPEEISKIAKVKAQVSEVKGIMMENIEEAGQCTPMQLAQVHQEVQIVKNSFTC